MEVNIQLKVCSKNLNSHQHKRDSRDTRIPRNRCCSACHCVLMYRDEIQLKETLETQGYQGIDVVVLAIVFSCIGMKYN